MEEFWTSLKPFFKALSKKYKAETVLIVIALVITLISITIFFSNLKRTDQNPIVSEKNPIITSSQKICVDIAGAVVNPDLYQVSPGSRIKDVLLMAGGLSEEADKSYFYRNYNLARLVNDQDKIYVPSVSEVNSGIVVEVSRNLDYTAPQIINYQQAITDTSPQIKININQASIEELDTLPGIGQATAQKIVQNRPYQNIEDLIKKKTVTKGIFDKIKDLATVN